MLHMLNPEFAKHAPVLLDIIQFCQEADPEPEALAEFIKEDADWMASWTWAMAILINNRVVGLSGSAIGVPFLSEQACDALVGMALDMEERHGAVPNQEEGKPYQIPEIVVKHHNEEAHRDLAGLIKYLNIWFLLINYTAPKSISAIQFTKYEPSETPNGNWHHDRDSDFTAVVSLAPEMFEGGGTDVRITPVDYHSIPPLNKGFALLLNGKTMQHRGRGVIAGTRWLLTYWLESGAPDGCDPIE